MRRSLLFMVCLTSACYARRVQSVAQEHGSRDWELENIVLWRSEALNDAELGMANLNQAMFDPSLLKDVANGLRSPEGKVELAKMLANPDFQEQMKALIETIDVFPEFLTPEFYANEQQAEGSSPPSVLASLLLAANPVPGRAASARGNVRMEEISDLKDLAMNLNPVVGYFDPLKLSEKEFWGQSNEATIGWLRHSEIKHGRVAMAAFVGFCIHENGIRWPWPWPTFYGLKDYSSFEGLSAPAVWDAMPSVSKVQILLLIGFFEFWGENSKILQNDGQSHYMRGGKPGFHPLLYRLINFKSPMSDEERATKLQSEINNGRLAMLGIMSLVAEAKVPGAVPMLAGVVKKYDGNPMDPFTYKDFADNPLRKQLFDFFVGRYGYDGLPIKMAKKMWP